MNENILKDFFDFAIKDVAQTGLHYGNSDRAPHNWEKDRGINKNQLSIMQIGKDWTDYLVWNYKNEDPYLPTEYYDFLMENVDLEDFHGFLEMIFNEAVAQRYEIRRMKGEDQTFFQEEKDEIIKKLQDKYNPYNFKTSKWKRVIAATPELIQKMQDQFYDPEQIIVANYVQQYNKSITVNPTNLEYWEKADIVSDLMRDRNFVSNLEAEARTFADGFIKEYNINDAEIVKEKFLEAIEEEINEVRDRYLNDIYNQIYQDGEKVGKDIAGYFMDNDPGDLERWPIKARLDEIKNLEEGYSNLSEYAHMWDFDEIHSFLSVADELEKADLDPGYEAWYDGLEEGFYSSINVRKIEDLLGTDTSYLYEPIDPSREAYLGPEQTDENEAKKHRREIADKWKIEYDKSKRDRLNWATEEDFPKKPWDFTSGFKKKADLSPELIDVAKQMAKDIVPHPLDYMRAQEEHYGSWVVPEYRSIILADKRNWLNAIETANESVDDGMWHSLHYEINENPYLDEDLKQEIDENIDEFRDEVFEQTEPVLERLWQETLDDYVNEISSTYEDIIFEATNRLIEDIEEYWDKKEVGRRVNAFISGQTSALELIDGLTVYAEQELEWLQDLHPIFEQVKENALKSADTYIEEKMPDLVQYISSEASEAVNEMYEPVDPSQEPYLGPEETDENEARKHRKEIKDKWKIEPNKPLEWATEEDFPKRPWDFQSKVATSNPFLPRLYHTMIENLKRTATFDWEADSNAWQKVQVAYEILNDWDDYVQEIKDDSGHKGENFHLSALMRDVFIDIFTPVWETISYLPPEQQSAWVNLHSKIAGTYPSIPYQIDAKLFNIFRSSDRKKDFSDLSKELREERTEEIKDKWEPEGWWKGGSKWKKISADEHDEEEEDEEEEERRSFDEIEWAISQNMSSVRELSHEAEDFVFSETSIRNFIQEFLFPLNRTISEEQMIQAADFFQSQQGNAEELVERFYDRTDFFNRMSDHLMFLIVDNFDWFSVVTEEEYDYYGNSLDDVLYEEAREVSNEVGQDAEGIVVDQIEDFLREGPDYIFQIYQQQAANKDRRITPDQEMMDVYDIMGELPDIPYEPQPVSPQVAEWMRQQSKVANIEDWSTPETGILMDEINRDSRILKPAIKTMEKIVRKGGTPEDLAAWLIENVLTPYNEHIGNQWEQISDEQDVEAQKNELRKTWKQQARKQFPFSLEKQKQYVKEMEQTQFGLLGDPKPEDIENYLLKVENINWQEIYDWVREDLQYRGKIASFKNYDDVYKKLYRGGVSYGVAAVRDLIRRETSREPYEHIDYSNPIIRKKLPQPDRFYDEDQLSVFREMIKIDDDIKQIAQAYSKREFKDEPIQLPLGHSEEELNDAINEGTQHFLRGYKDAINGKYKHQLDLSRKLRKDPELWKSSAPEQKEEEKYIYKLLNLLMACANEGRSHAFRSLGLLGEEMGMKLIDTNEMMEARDYRLDENQLKIWPEMIKPDPEKDFSNVERAKLLANYAIGGPELDNFIRSLPDGDKIQVDERVDEAMSDAYVIGYESALRNLSFIDSVPVIGNLVMEKFSSEKYEDSYKRMYDKGFNYGVKKVKDTVQKQKNLYPDNNNISYKEDRFYNPSQLSLLKENVDYFDENQIMSAGISLRNIAENLSRRELPSDPDILEKGVQSYLAGYKAGVSHQLGENSKLTMERSSTHGQRQMAIGDEVAETHFEGVPEDPEPEPEEKEINGKKWKMVRPKPNKQPADYAKPKSGWGFYSRHKKSESEEWIDRVTDSTRRDIEKILNDLPDQLKVRATVDADDTVREWVRHALMDELSENSLKYNPAKGIWEDSQGYAYDLSPYEEKMLPFHNTEKSRLIHKDQVNLGIEQVRSMADVALYRRDRFDRNLKWEIADGVQLYFSDLGYFEQESFVKEILRLLTPLDKRELEQMYNDAYYKSWEKAFNDEVADLEGSKKTSKKDAWEAVIDGELGHDILTTGTWDKVKKQTIKWLEELKDGYINKKNPHDNKKIDSEAKEQDGHALESLKSYEGEKRWSFHFDHGKHPYDLIIQPVGYKESANDWRHGDCDLFAIKAHKDTGWPIYKIAEKPNSEAWHFFVMNPETGMALDGDGYRDVEDILKEHDPDFNSEYEALGVYPEIYKSSLKEAQNYRKSHKESKWKYDQKTASEVLINV